jgi:choline dehydrogenase-like flavoprotein
MNDPIKEGLAKGWKAIDAAALERDRDIECDVVVIGSGAGGGVTAEILAQAGLAVTVVEEGPLASSSEFNMREREAYPRLYQESAGRQTLDKGITILQGRCVGGGTTVNWTSSFRTPPRTLAHWGSAHGLKSVSRERAGSVVRAHGRAPGDRRLVDAAEREQRHAAARLREAGLHVGPHPPQCEGLRQPGLLRHGLPAQREAVDARDHYPRRARSRGHPGASRARDRLVVEGNRVVACEAAGVERNGAAPRPHRVRLRARHFVLAAGAIGSPASCSRARLPIPTAPPASARSCTPRWSPAR